MMIDETVKKLMQISTPKSFKAREFICYEGQPGNEMYIILRGSVGIYVSSAVETQVEVSRIKAGDFFGEMAVFDNLPRSASCMALEDVVCIAIGRDKMERFIGACPEMAMKILENMSSRIRRLDNEVFKSEKFVRNKNLAPFAVPPEYSYSHAVDEPAHDSRFIETVTAACPICGNNITLPNLKRGIMSMHKQRSDGRIKYAECEPLWYDIWSCPHCRYSNYYLSFFRLQAPQAELVKRLLSEQHIPVLTHAEAFASTFDRLFLRYLQAIHINEACNANDYTLLGKLWLGLYWLFEDAEDEKMKLYCAGNACEYISKAITENMITDDFSRRNMALTAANLLIQTGREDLAQQMCDIAIKG